VPLGYNYIFKYKASAFFKTFLKDLEISVLDIDISITTIDMYTVTCRIYLAHAVQYFLDLIYLPDV
jgi:hypothetical protein